MLLKVPFYRGNIFQKYVVASLHPADFFWVPGKTAPADPNAVVEMGNVRYTVNCRGKLQRGWLGLSLGERTGQHESNAPIKFDFSQNGDKTVRDLVCDYEDKKTGEICGARIPYKAHMTGTIGNHVLRFDAWQWGGAGISKKKVRANIIYPASSGESMPSGMPPAEPS